MQGLKTDHSLYLFTRFDPQNAWYWQWATKEQHENSFASMALLKNVLFKWNLAHPLAPPPILGTLCTQHFLRYKCAHMQLLTASYLIYYERMAAHCFCKVYRLIPCCCRKTSPVISWTHSYIGLAWYIITIFLETSRWYGTFKMHSITF